MENKERKNDPINLLVDFMKYEDTQVVKLWKSLNENLKEGRYSLADYGNILAIAQNLNFVGFKEANSEQIGKKISDNIQQEHYVKTNVSMREYPYWHSLESEYEKIWNRVQIIIEEKQKADKKQFWNTVVKNTNKIEKIIKVLTRRYFEEKKYIRNYLNVSMVDLSKQIMNFSNEELTELYDDLNALINSNNLYNVDKNEIITLKKELESLEDKMGKIQKRNIQNICSVLNKFDLKLRNK